MVEDNFFGLWFVWDKVGVIFIYDVSFFEKVKFCILNGIYLILVYIGLLFGKEIVFDVMCILVIK